MNAKYNRSDDILMITFSDRPIDDAEERGPFIFHYDSEGKLVLLEMADVRAYAAKIMSNEEGRIELD